MLVTARPLRSSTEKCVVSLDSAAGTVTMSFPSSMLLDAFSALIVAATVRA